MHLQSETRTMIQPVSIKMHNETVLIDGDSVKVEVCRIASGRMEGKAIALIRYLPHDKWQVMKLRGVIDPKHYSTVNEFEQALHLVMASAYEYLAFN